MKITIKIIFFISVISLYTYGGYKTGFVEGQKSIIKQYESVMDSIKIEEKKLHKKLDNTSNEIMAFIVCNSLDEELLNHSEIK